MVNFSSQKPTRSQADELVDCPKLISAVVSWVSQSNGSKRLVTAAYSTTPRHRFEIRGYIGKTNYSFVLLYNNFPIRKFTKHAQNILNGKVFNEPHKHTWDDINEDHSDGYIPNNINIDSPIPEQFLAFCRECNIKLLSGCQSSLLSD